MPTRAPVAPAARAPRRAAAALLLAAACAQPPAPAPAPPQQPPLPRTARADDLDFRALLRPIPGRVERDADGTIRIHSDALLRDPDHHVWGASPARGADGRWHLFYARFPAAPHPFGDAWLFGSVIAHAVSDRPDGGFVHQGVTLPGAAAEGRPEAWDAQGTHNPHVLQVHGRTYLYYIGSCDPGEQPPGSPGHGLRARDRIQQVQATAWVAAESPEALAAGRFERPRAPMLAARTRVKPPPVVDPSPPGTEPLPDNLVIVNPSVVRAPRGGDWLLYFKGNLWDPDWRGVHGVARAPAPDGPYTRSDRFVFDVRDADGRIASAEDPFVWYDPARRRLYALVKDFRGRMTGAGPALALLTSEDGLDWQPARHPLAVPKELHFSDGTVLPVRHLERPQLLLDEAGRPRVLYLACIVGDGYAGHAFNVAVPLGEAAPSPPAEPPPTAPGAPGEDSPGRADSASSQR